MQLWNQIESIFVRYAHWKFAHRVEIERKPRIVIQRLIRCGASYSE